MPNLGETLQRVVALAKMRGGSIVASNELERSDRELLINNHWLHPIIKGWYMLAKPDVSPGDSSLWYGNFWDFVRIYLSELYGEEYCLSAGNSIDLHLHSPTIPEQLIVLISKNGGNPVHLPFKTSILAYKDLNLPKEIVKVQGIQVMDLPLALCKVAPTFFHTSPQEAEIALRMIRSPADLVEVIVKNNLRRAGNRMVGAYAFLGDEKFANTMESELKHFGMHVTQENPFLHPSPFTTESVISPYVPRIHSLWQNHRSKIIEHFPEPPGLNAQNKAKYLLRMEEKYTEDAYNSLSIEGYKVDDALIERVINNDWDPDNDQSDRMSRDPLAARGYYDAFQQVKNSIKKIFLGEIPGKVIREDLHIWYRSLFGPSTQMGILEKTDLIGYRKWQVYIKNSRHVPLPKEALVDAMDALFDCLEQEPHPAVRAILGHTIFVYIHPYMDGNGRIARFLMNTMLASGGYPWTIVHASHRDEYINALEMTHVDQDIESFVRFIANEINFD